MADRGWGTSGGVLKEQAQRAWLPALVPWRSVLIPVLACALAPMPVYGRPQPESDIPAPQDQAQGTAPQPPAPPAAAAPATEPPGHHHHHKPPESVATEEEGITVTTRRLAPDPLRGMNAASFGVINKVDEAVLAPVAHAYERNVPEPARDGLHNALRNLREPVIAANFLLQHRIGKTGQTLARFVINSTVGLAGLFDVARRKPFHMPWRENGFADTMGFYGVGPGPYLFLPLIGSTTVRDLAGRVADRAVLPIALGSRVIPTAAAVPMLAISVLDKRVENDERITNQRTQAARGGDLYAIVRDDYLRRRKAEIDGLHSHRAPRVEKEEEAPQPAATPPPAPAQSPPAGATPAGADTSL